MFTVVVTEPAVEPLTLDEVKKHLRLDQTNQELAPTEITAALADPAVAGNVDDGAHRYLCTFVTDDGETEAGIVSDAVTVDDKAVNGKVELTAIPIGGDLVTFRKLYRTAAGGTTYLLLATLADNTTIIYTDNIADSALGAGAPATNTTTDPELNRMITTARQAAESELHRYIITQTLDSVFDKFPALDGTAKSKNYFELPPLASVTSIKYIDTDGNQQTVSSADYTVDIKSKPARISLAHGASWPSARAQHNAIEIRYVAGYGVAADVPECIKTWMLMRIAVAEERPSPVITGAVLQDLPSKYMDGLLDPERISSRI